MGIFSKLKQVFSAKEDADIYLSGLNRSKRAFLSEFVRLL